MKLADDGRFVRTAPARDRWEVTLVVERITDARTGETMIAAESALAPCDVTRERDVNALDASAWDGREFWMLVGHDGTVHIHRQRDGEPSTEKISIPRKTFQRMIEWYQRPQE